MSESLLFQVFYGPGKEATREAPKVTHTYPVTRDQNFNIPSKVIAAIEDEASHNMENYMYMAPHEHESAYKRIKDYCARFWRAMSYRGGHANIHLPPRPLYPGLSSQPAYPGSSSAAPTHAAHPGSSSGPPVRPQWIAPLTSSSSYTPHPTRTLGAGSSSRGPRVDDLEYTSRGGTNKEEEAEDIERRTPRTIQMANSLFSANPYPEEINASQLSGVTLAPTQVSHEAFTTLIAYQEGRSACHVGAAEHHTYSQRNTKEVQVADRRAGKTAASAQRHKRGRI